MGTLSYLNQKFYFQLGQGEAAHAERVEAEKAGLKFDADTLRWITRNFDKARTLRRFADGAAEAKLKQHFITHFKAPEQILYPNHLSPRTWQLKSAWHCVTRSPAYCADEAGMGKTPVAVMCMNTVPGQALVICPPYLVHNWQREIKTWSTRKNARVEIIESGKEDEETFNADILIMPDSLVANPRIRALIYAQLKFTWLFVDEAHRYKEATTQRTQSLVGKEAGHEASKASQEWFAIAMHATRVVFLSGTPIPNGRPIELFPVLNGVAPESIHHRSYLEYGKTFCSARRVVRHEGRRCVVNWDFKGSSNLGLLNKELCRALMIRHEKKDHMKELGKKEDLRKIVFLDPDTKAITKELHRFEREVLRDYTLDELLGEEHTLGDVARYRREVGEAKINPAFQYIRDLLDERGDKLVVFAHHISVVERLTKQLYEYKPLMIRGGMSRKQKAMRVDHFQRREEHRVVVGNMDAMGTGNTLTKAKGMVIVEPSWVPGINEQAEDRIHRITQTSLPYFHYLVMWGTLDERMLHRVMAKEKNIKKAMGSG